MRVKKSISKNSVSYSIIKDITKNGKRTSVIVERLGNEKEILQKHPEADSAEAFAKAYAKSLNEKEKQGHTQIVTKYNRTKLIEKNSKRRFNVGHLFINKVLAELGIKDILNPITDSHKITFDLAQILTMLVSTRILYPASKKHAYQQAKNFLFPPTFDIQHVYRALDILAKESDTIEKALYDSSLKIADRNTKILYYDCTNFYFEIEQEDGIKRYGKSKEHRPNPIVQMGLFMDATGLPLAFNIFAGNKNEQPMLKPLEQRILDDFGLSKFVVCTDAGLSSNANKRFNTLGQRAFVTTQSIKKMNQDLIAWALNPTGWRLEGSDQLYDLRQIDLSPENENVYYKQKWVVHDKTKTEKAQNLKAFEEHIMVTFSPVYKNYQENVRQDQIQRAIRRIDKQGKPAYKNPNDIKRFIKEVHFTEDGEVADNMQVTLNEEKIEKEKLFDGFYAVSTNLDATPSEIIAVNKRRWQIEESFRIMKTEFKTRPFYLQNEQRIKAHFLSCFIALLVFRILQQRLSNFTCSQIIETLREIQWVKQGEHGFIPAYERTDLTDKLHEVSGFRTDYELFDHKMVKKLKKISSCSKPMR